MDTLCCFQLLKGGKKKCGFYNSAKLDLTDFQINKWQLQSPPGDPFGGAKRIRSKKRGKDTSELLC